ncbi:SLBB domain-containing protein [[Limnothrix rosea] IAM M-220]|uniref:SLBB domain-containing protein n=1 Tax=[Limnothrix rosea] IAM M-220 TaxID=454133 RepID=UPI00095D0926|nr:SLBB domain-containing protein [[Limnothrix rosea] IAM M-220]OKH13186.1 hypothetical protein NIES208_15285 [[Limnothrix rosea] IAM M-220]
MKLGSLFFLSRRVIFGAIAATTVTPFTAAVAIQAEDLTTPQLVAQSIAPDNLEPDLRVLPTIPRSDVTPPPFLERDPLPDSYWEEVNPFQGVFPQPQQTEPRSLPVFSPSGAPAAVAVPQFPNRDIPSIDELEADYRLDAGDTIQLEFFNTPEYNGQYALEPFGTITLPLVGRVDLRGLTIAEAGDRLAVAYAPELRFPEVDVTLINRRPLQIVMGGEIVQPGLYTFPSNTGGQAPRLFQALQNAGGITPAGDIARVQITRDSENPTLSHTISVNLLALLNQGDLSQNIDLRDGDVITVPAAAILDVDTVEQLALSNVRSQSTLPVDVAVLGEVGLPGPYRFGAGDQTTIVRAIQQAGGLSPFADVRNVTLERKTRSGSLQKITIDLFAILESGRIDQDVTLQAGDVIQIPQAELNNEQITALTSSTLSRGPIEVAILGEVNRPGGLQVKANTSLSQAIIAAGGFNNLARKKVKLLRFNPDGTVSEKKIEVDLDRTINPEDNPILQPNDIIMVGKSTWGTIRETLTSVSRNVNFLLPYLFFLNDQ